MARTPERRSDADNRPGREPDNRLADLGKRLSGVQRRRDVAGRSDKRGSQIGVAMRLATEFVAGPAVGAFIGWFLDDWFSTSPLFLLVLFILGAVAGGRNVFRTARRMQSANVAKETEPDRGKED